MELQLNKGDGPIITAFSDSGFTIDDKVHKESVLVHAGHEVAQWSVNSMAELSESHIAKILDYSPEIVIFGTGEKQVFPETKLLADLINSDCGHEIMDTAAACRTYSVLMTEGRNVLAALIL